MAARTDPEKNLIDTAMSLAVERGWHELSLAEIAAKARVPLTKAIAIAPSKTALLARLAARTDDAVLAAVDKDGLAETLAEVDPRDRLFDVIMNRFEALAPYKEGLRRVHQDTGGDPLALLDLAPAAVRSARRMLEAAGVDSSGVGGFVMVQGLVVLYARVLPTWLSDDDTGLATTMADLDRRLRRAEWLWARIGPIFRRPGRQAA